MEPLTSSIAKSIPHALGTPFVLWIIQILIEKISIGPKNLFTPIRGVAKRILSLLVKGIRENIIEIIVFVAPDIILDSYEPFFSRYT